MNPLKSACIVAIFFVFGYALGQDPHAHGPDYCPKCDECVPADAPNPTISCEGEGCTVDVNCKAACDQEYVEDRLRACELAVASADYAWEMFNNGYITAAERIATLAEIADAQGDAIDDAAAEHFNCLQDCCDCP